MDRPAFNPGQVYDRETEIHKPFGGLYQRGISPSAKFPAVFIFNSLAGHAYGYHDGWQEDGSFWFSGEGKSGDQEFTNGNKRIRDSNVECDQIFLFRKTAPRLYQFDRELRLIDWKMVEGLGEDGLPRQAIRFVFMPVTSESSKGTIQTEDPNTGKLEVLRERAYADDPTGSLQERVAIVRKRSRNVRDYVLVRAGGVCELCEKPAPFVTNSGRHFLEVHHVFLLSEDGLDSPQHAAALCPNCHREAHHGPDPGAILCRLLSKLAEMEPVEGQLVLAVAETRVSKYQKRSDG